jgi:hypothetical protein
MYAKQILLLIPIFFIILAFGHAISWDASVGSWNIHRHSQTLSLSLEDYCQGNISVIEIIPGQRSTKGYHSRYLEVNLNDVQLSERTNAKAGQISAEEYTHLLSEAIEPITMNTSKPGGSPVYTFEFTEIWPVVLSSVRAIVYDGTGINDRDLAGNNLDFAGVNLIYSTELSRIRVLDAELKRMNATVIADNMDVIGVDFQPNKHMVYRSESYSTGIATLRYRQTAPDMTAPYNEGIEYFNGKYLLNATLEMGVISNKLNDTSRYRLFETMSPFH